MDEEKFLDIVEELEKKEKEEKLASQSDMHNKKIICYLSKILGRIEKLEAQVKNNAQSRDLNSYCVTRHMHYKRPQQCFLIKNILSSTKENNRRHSYVNKKSWRFFSHIYINRLGGKS